tara:strand:+ start:79 stop:597 length:519 start_codon:yes stop_codon:yes gene_type:complete
MHGLETAKLILSDYLVEAGKPCKQTDCNSGMIEAARIFCHWPARVTAINSYQMKLVILALSNAINDRGYINNTVFQDCLLQICKPLKEKKKKKKLPLKIDSKWRAIRYQALKLGGGKCCLCGMSPKDGVKLHVDHIKPKSLFPHLAYDLNNLQVLCEDCNMGKSNKDDTDWR